MANDLRVLVYPNKEDKTVFYELDVYDSNGEAGNFPLTFQIVDIAEPKNRKSDFSKTVTFPGTARNNQFFTQLYEITTDSDFNPNLKKYVSVLKDGLEILRGTIKLNNIKRVKVDLISYECTLFGQFANIFQELKVTNPFTGEERDLLLRDLFTIEFQGASGENYYSIDHTLSWETISKSWHGLYVKDGGIDISIDYSPPIAFSDTFYNSSGDWVGRLGLTGATAHGAEVGDVISLQMTNPSLNPTYTAEWTVLEVPDSNSLVINTPFVNSTTAETGQFSITTPTGKGYIYPLLNLANSTNETTIWSIARAGQDFYPAIFTKEVLDRIFKYARFTYDSQFLQSKDFKRTLFLSRASEGLKLKAQEIEDRLFKATKTSVSSQTRFPWDGGGVPPTIDEIFIADNNSTDGNFDDSGAYDTAIGRWTVPGGGYYSVDATVNISSFIKAATGATGFLGSSVGDDPLEKPFSTYGKAWLELNNSTGVVLYTSTEVIFRLEELQSAEVDDTGYTFDDQVLTGFYSGFFEVGDYVEARVRFQAFQLTGIGPGGLYEYSSSLGNFLASTSSSGIGTVSSDWFLTVKTGSIFNSVTRADLPINSTLAISSLVDQRMTAAEFLSSIFTMFNLYVYPDRLEERKLIIEPRDDFYNDQFVNWTSKLDRVRDLVITPLGLIQSKTYLFSYKEDRDFNNQNYLKENLTTYGSLKLSTENDFVRGQKDVRVDFSPSPLIPIIGNKYVTNIVRDSVEGGFTLFNPRILYYGGLKPCPITPFFEVIESPDLPETNYPYAGHLNDPLDPTIDLNWGYARMYYDFARLTENTLVNAYYLKYLEEVLSPDSRVVTGYFKLTARDIRELDFRKQVIVDGVRYRLLKITDFNATRNELTQVELLKILDDVKYVVNKTNQSPSSGVNPIGGPGTPLPNIDDISRDPYGTNNNSGSNPGDDFVGDGIILGSNNTIRNNGRQIIIQGSGNDVQANEKVHLVGNNNKVLGAGSSRISLINSDGNTIAPGVTDVYLINTYGATVSQNGAIYIGNVNFTPPVSSSLAPVYKATVVINPSEVLTLNSSPVLLVEAPGVDKCIEVIHCSVQMKYATTPYDTNTSLRIRNVGSDFGIAAQNDVLLSTVSRTLRMDASISTSAGTTGSQVTENTGIELYVNAGNPLNGDGALQINLFYTITDY